MKYFNHHLTTPRALILATTGTIGVVAWIWFGVLATPTAQAGPYQLDTTGQNTLGTVNETHRLTTDMHRRFTHDDQAQWRISQQMLQQTVENIVNHVSTGGPDGGPLFIQNLGQHLQRQVDNRVQNYINTLGSNLDTPFLGDVQNALQQVHTMNMRGELPGYNAQSVGNINAFLGGDFSQGGWDGFYEVVSSPGQNTPVGAQFVARRGMSNVAQQTVFEETTKANWADGFKAIEQCDGNNLNCQITTPGRVVSDQLTRALGAPIDSLIASDSADQQIDTAFSQLGEQAISGASGLLGSGFDFGMILNALLNELGLDLNNLNLDFDLNELLRDLFAEFDSEDGAAIATGSQSIEGLLTSSLDVEEEYLRVINQALDDGRGDEAELLEMANDALANITALNDLVIRYNAVTGQIGNTITEANAEALMDIVSEYTTLKDTLHNQADITLLRVELNE